VAGVGVTEVSRQPRQHGLDVGPGPVPAEQRGDGERVAHTAASLMIQASYPPKMLREILGHASITTTLDLYGHLYSGEMDRYADRLDSAAGDAGKAKIRPDDDEGDEDEK
jgi:hypothetical protein